MSRLINVSDDVYASLTMLKKERSASYSEVILGLMQDNHPSKKKHGWDEILVRLEAKAAKFKGKRVKTDHDRILYGAMYENR
jgi:predicted CopG family antitoxin